MLPFPCDRVISFSSSMAGLAAWASFMIHSLHPMTVAPPPTVPLNPSGKLLELSHQVFWCLYHGMLSSCSSWLELTPGLLAPDISIIQVTKSKYRTILVSPSSLTPSQSVPISYKVAYYHLSLVFSVPFPIQQRVTIPFHR